MDRAEILDAVRHYAQENLVHSFTPGKTYIPPAAPQLLPEDVEAVADATLNFWYTEWKYCRRFEREIEKATGKHFVSLVNSGSSASLVAVTAALRHFDPLKWKQYVITCAVGFPTTVSPIIQNGYTPIFVDMKEDLTPNLDQVKEVLDRYGDQIVGAVFAHTLGFPFDEIKVRDLIGNDRFLVSDCCDALGASIRGGISVPDGVEYVAMPVGSYSDLSTLSFFPSHHIMAGEGGAVMTNNEILAAMVTSISNWGRSCYCRPGESNTCGSRFNWPDRGGLPEGWDHKYIFSELGYNLKMTEFQGALGYSQIKRLPDLIRARRENFRYLYRELIRPDYAAHLYLMEPSDVFSPFGFPILVTSDAFTLNDLVSYLESHQVGTRRLFGGNLLEQPAFMSGFNFVGGDLNGADRLMENLIWISVSPSLNESMLEYMVYTIEQFFIEKGLV